MAKRPRLTYNVTWRNEAGDEVTTEVSVRAKDSEEGKRLAQAAAAEFFQGKANQLDPSNPFQRFQAEHVPHRIDL